MQLFLYYDVVEEISFRVKHKFDTCASPDKIDTLNYKNSDRTEFC